MFLRPATVVGTVISAVEIRQQVKFAPRKRWQTYANRRPVGPEYLRLNVCIRTQDGWILSGNVGTATNRDELPDVRVGDSVEVQGVTLSLAYADRTDTTRGIFRPNTLCGTIRGKVVGRKSVRAAD